jgi:23S rRNA (uracil1939-C5)-methyltransferase
MTQDQITSNQKIQSLKKPKQYRQFKVLIKGYNERGYGIATDICDIDPNSQKQIPTELYVLGALDQEEVICESFKTKKGVYFANALEIIKPSKFRVLPKDEQSYKASSPWQIMEFTNELEIKTVFINNLYSGLLETQIEVFTNYQEFSYRNKVEFSFYENFEDYDLTLAFYKREGNIGKYSLTYGTSLVSQKVNEFALLVTRILKESSVSGKDLKTIILREADHNINVQLYVKSPDLLDRYPQLQCKFDELKNFEIYYSNPLSPASVITAQIYPKNTKPQISSQSYIINNTKYSFLFRPEGFFQVNPPVFKSVIEDIILNINFKSKNLLDLYCGVGVIGQLLASKFVQVVGVDLSIEAKEFSQSNAIKNQLTNYNFVLAKAEMVVDNIQSDQVLFLDPPRSGCHVDVLNQINKILPRQILYLSCNPITQKRDFEILKTHYKIVWAKAYNFYPKTPHLESLIVLELLD